MQQQAARAAALRLAISREQEAAQSLLQQREERQAAPRSLLLLDAVGTRLRRYAVARMGGLAARAEARSVERAWVRAGVMWTACGVDDDGRGKRD